MSEIKRRLTHLWRRTNAPDPPRPWPPLEPESKMLVTIIEPMKISGTVLSPGRYAFRLLHPGAARTLVQIFNEDQTSLVATLTTLSDN